MGQMESMRRAPRAAFSSLSRLLQSLGFHHGLDWVISVGLVTWAPSGVSSSMQRKHARIYAKLLVIYCLTFCGLLVSAIPKGGRWFMSFVIGGNALVMITLMQPVEAAPGSSWWLQLIPGRQTVSLFALVFWHLTQVEAMPPVVGFIWEPFALGFVGFMIQLILVMRAFPTHVTAAWAILIPTMHFLNPIFGIGTSEAMILAFGEATGFLCGCAISSDQQLLLATLEIANMNRRADSRLNHVIKGQCGGANALLSGLLKVLETQSGTKATQEVVTLVHQIKAMLDDAAEWCHSREVFVQLEAGTYQMSLSQMPLRKELQSQVSAFGKVEAMEEVIVDPNLVRLLVHEALSNAFKYAQQGTPIIVKAELKEDERNKGESRQGSLLSITITNTNRAGVPHLTESECKMAFMKSSKRGGPSYNNSSSCCRSDGVGLDSVKLATDHVGGRCWLQATKTHTTLHVELPAASCESEPSVHGATSATVATSATATTAYSPLKVAADAAKKTNAEAENSPLHSALELQDPPSWVGPTSSNGFPHFDDPSMPGDLDMPSSNAVPALEDANAQEHDPEGQLKRDASNPIVDGPPVQPFLESLSRAPVCIGIDDSPMLRKMQETLFNLFMDADSSRSGSIGSCMQEVDAYVDVVMGKRTLSLEPADLPPADIAVLDENIDLDDREEHSARGSELALELRRRGFRGVICILTGAHRETVHQIARKPGIDFAFEKNGDLKSIASKLMESHAKRTMRG